LHPGSIPGEASNCHTTAFEPEKTRRFCAKRADGDMNAEYSELRAKMVDGQIRTTDVTNPAILLAMGSVPREAFVDARHRELAYIDESLEISSAQGGQPARFLMDPSPFAKLLQLAEVRSADTVLDIGCGTGYSSAVISCLAASVVALESEPTLATRAAATLSDLGHDNVTVVTGWLPGGHPSEAPYDVIFVGGAVDEVPQTLFDQLRERGRLVTVEGHGNAGIARLYLKDNGLVAGRGAFNAAIPPLPGFEKPRIFEF
jgi:protein-L-isoaspartate(D-aspartate) O-methyltransferase